MQRNTGYFPTESLEPSGNRLFSRSALNEGYLFRGSLGFSSQINLNANNEVRKPFRAPILVVFFNAYFATGPFGLMSYYILYL